MNARPTLPRSDRRGRDAPGGLARAARLRRACSARRTRACSRARRPCGGRSRSRCTTRSSGSRTRRHVHYTVWSQIDPPPAAELRAAPNELPPALQRSYRVYLQLPAARSRRARARSRTVDHGQPDEQLRQGAVAIERLARREPELHARARRTRPPGADRLLPVRSQEGPLRVLRVGVRDPRAARTASRPARSTASSAASGTSTRATSRSAPATRTRGTRSTSPARAGSRSIRRRRIATIRSAAAAAAGARGWPVHGHAAVPVDEVGDRVRPRRAALAVQGHRPAIKTRRGRVREALIVRHAAGCSPRSPVAIAIVVILRRRRRRELDPLAPSARARPRVAFADRAGLRPRRAAAREGRARARARASRRSELAARLATPFAADVRELTELYYAAEWGGRDDPAAERRAGELADAITSRALAR